MGGGFHRDVHWGYGILTHGHTSKNFGGKLFLEKGEVLEICRTDPAIGSPSLPGGALRVDGWWLPLIGGKVGADASNCVCTPRRQGTLYTPTKEAKSLRNQGFLWKSTCLCWVFGQTSGRWFL